MKKEYFGTNFQIFMYIRAFYKILKYWHIVALNLTFQAVTLMTFISLIFLIFIKTLKDLCFLGLWLINVRSEQKEEEEGQRCIKIHKSSYLRALFKKNHFISLIQLCFIFFFLISEFQMRVGYTIERKSPYFATSHYFY